MKYTAVRRLEHACRARARGQLWRAYCGNRKERLARLGGGANCHRGAQAADIPVRAKEIQYVKACSLYGTGFYYVPGSDTCGWLCAR
ncbi:porin [Bradyrhizobium sp. CCBAU 11386]|uniref:porin n=1 Tax=Bradyrhizobium sp. CCBAU 11386 TaxID=1630837 RepID=UPI0023044C42|nr:porin [Bradyrhizobium sp. CCBAU 11386]